MLDLVKGEAERIDSCFLDLACGSGNFLVAVLRCTLAAVSLTYGTSDFERQHYALLALMCIYGIELLRDNSAECGANLLEIFAEYLDLVESDNLYRAALYVLSQNLVHGDTLTMRTHDGQSITSAEWELPGQRHIPATRLPPHHARPSPLFSAERLLFAHLTQHELFTLTKVYLPMTVERTGYCLVRYCREGGQR